MSNINNLISQCRYRWEIDADDDKFRNFCDKLPEFLSEFDPDSRKMVDTLLCMFKYYSHPRIGSCFKQLHARILVEKFYDEDDTIFCVLKSVTGKMNSGSEYLIEYDKINHVNKNDMISDIDKLDMEDWNNIRSVIFIDDICGSGRTFTDFIEQYSLQLRGKKIVYAVIYAMNSAVDRIYYTGNVNGLDTIIKVSVHMS